ncbi:hypothetical protein CJ178_04605 [Rhodococcus sp. ACPA4]|uniref:Uncharacterized protein n=1 Tax=Rhodococcus globerulus TaxID=33008 RepID=A0ABU4BLU7_RHOGO|nr:MULTISPECIES: hypothetical protein [Rhodococcus]MDV6265189.1 hypothetical protein [Rhodococcus globerulus]MDV8068370.1 hypothetical protein [Rhodococcus sp. IEGM 1366]PBC40971.1 hypothetical protein CJ178_04605 [Rhodococcus sp. ACPA4]
MSEIESYSSVGSDPGTVLIVLKRAKLALLWGASYHPIVTINGRAEALPWGAHRVAFSDAEPLSIDVYVNERRLRSLKSTIGRCAAIIPPGTARAVEYSAPAQGFCRGELGPLGTTRSRGLVAQFLIVGVLALICGFMAIGLLGVGLAAMTGQLGELRPPQ